MGIFILQHNQSGCYTPINDRLTDNKVVVGCTHLLSVPNSTRSLLTVTTGKLVTDLRRFHRPNTDLAELVTLLVDRHHHLNR